LEPLMRVGWTVALIMTACVSPLARGLEIAAVLEQSDANARATLTTAVSEMLLGARVTLAEDALLHDSHLTVERARPRATDGQLLNGRILERPEQFQLIKEQEQCVLVQQSSGRRKVLPSIIGCRAL
jgi:hypothetical protein